MQGGLCCSGSLWAIPWSLSLLRCSVWGQTCLLLLPLQPWSVSIWLTWPPFASLEGLFTTCLTWPPLQRPIKCSKTRAHGCTKQGFSPVSLQSTSSTRNRPISISIEAGSGHSLLDHAPQARAGGTDGSYQSLAALASSPPNASASRQELREGEQEELEDASGADKGEAKGEAERARVILYWLQVEVLKLTRTARWRAHRYRSVSCATETYVARNRLLQPDDRRRSGSRLSVGKKSCWPLGQRDSRGHRAWRFRASLLSQRGYPQV